MCKYVVIESNKDTSTSKDKEPMVPVSRMDKEVDFRLKDQIRTIEEALRVDYANFKTIKREDNEVAFILLSNIYRKLEKLGCKFK